MLANRYTPLTQHRAYKSLILVLLFSVVVGMAVSMIGFFINEPLVIIGIGIGLVVAPLLAYKIANLPQIGIAVAFIFAPFYETVLGLVRVYTAFPERILTGWTDALVWTIFMGSVMRYALMPATERQRRSYSLLFFILLFFVVWSFVGVLASPSVLQGYLGFHWTYLWPLTAVAFWLNPLPQKAVRTLLLIAITALCISALIGLFQQIVLGQSWTVQFYQQMGFAQSGVPGGILRMPSTMAGPWRSGPAYFYLTVLALAFVLYDTTLMHIRPLFYGIVFVGVVGVIFTISRASWVALPIGVLIVMSPLVLRNLIKISVLSVLVTTVLVGLLFTNTGFQYALDTIVTLNRASDSSRFDRAMDNLTFSVTNYPMGAGAGTSGVFLNTGTTASKTFQTTRIDSRRGENDNFYVKLMWELGIPGVTLLMLISGGMLLFYGRLYLHPPEPWAKAVATSAIAFIVGAHIMMLTSNLLDWNPLKIYYWMLLAFIPSFHQRYGKTL